MLHIMLCQKIFIHCELLQEKFMARHTTHIECLKGEIPTIDQFMEAAKSFNVDLLNRFLRKMPHEVKHKIIAHNDYEIFVWAANNGSTKLLNKLLEAVPPEQRQYMIIANHFEALECAVSNDHIQVVKRLLEVAPPEHKSSMVARSADIALKRSIDGMLEAILAHANENERNLILEEAMERGLIEGNHSMY